MVADFTDAALPLGDGCRIEARIVTWEANDALKVPLSALFRQRRDWNVFVIKNGLAERCPIETGHRSAFEAEVFSKDHRLTSRWRARGDQSAIISRQEEEAVNQAHIHLLLNHLPVVGTIFSVLLVAAAMLRKNDELRKVSLGFVVLVALAAIPTYLTGEPAEKIVEHLPGVSDALIESHEEAALFSLIAMEVAGIASLAGLLIFRRRGLPNAMVAGALVITLVAAGLMGWTANLGGQIRHAEIRSGFTAPAENGKGETEGHLKEAGERERR